MLFKPCNRHLLIKPIEEDEIEKTGILLPDDYKAKNPFGVAQILKKSDDCTIDVFPGEKITYSSNMIQNITIGGKEFILLLENYVLGIIHEKD
jgi:co-chaperonin GroES (HSP10)